MAAFSRVIGGAGSKGRRIAELARFEAEKWNQINVVEKRAGK
jgi:hypothetical protein